MTRLLIACTLTIAALLLAGDFSPAASTPETILILGDPASSRFLKVLARDEEGVAKPEKLNGRQYLTVEAPAGSKPDASPIVYLYLGLDPGFAKTLGKDCFVAVEYFDNSYGTIQLQYNAKGNDYRYAEPAGNVMLNTDGRRKALFFLPDIAFAGKQNAGADFRLEILGKPMLSAVSIAAAGADGERVLQSLAPQLEKTIRGGKDFQVVFGGMDISKPEEAPGTADALTYTLPVWRQLGATSNETYVRWNLIEREKGKYDFSAYDPQAAVYKRLGMKWVPFIIIGPPYALPDWYYNSKERVDSVCLEHNQKSDVQSIWNPALQKYIDGFLHAFAEHYRAMGVIESVILGISGNYGESIYCATGNQDWTNQTHGEYHSHSGYWCADEHAMKDYRFWLRKRFGDDIKKLNERWGTQFANFDAISPDSKPGGSQFLDFVEWYRGSMTNWVEFWCRTARKYFPAGDIYMVTGGHMPRNTALTYPPRPKSAPNTRSVSASPTRPPPTPPTSHTRASSPPHAGSTAHTSATSRPAWSMPTGWREGSITPPPPARAMSTHIRTCPPPTPPASKPGPKPRPS